MLHEHRHKNQRNTISIRTAVEQTFDGEKKSPVNFHMHENRTSI